jgi:hypothetical protein
MDFTQPRLGVDHGGDFLLEIFHSPYSKLAESVLWRLQLRYGRVLDMLLHDSEDVFEVKGYDANDERINRDSLSHLLQLTRDIKKRPVRLTRLLVQTAAVDSKLASRLKEKVLTFDLRNMVEVVKKYCLGNDETSNIRYSHELAIVLITWRDELAHGWNDQVPIPDYLQKEKIGPDELAMRCTQVIHGLMAGWQGLDFERADQLPVLGQLLQQMQRQYG